jgi:sec-independent protein translocase protein TatB
VFDVGFWELLFIFTLALIVLGPDKLPAVVSTLGRWTGRARALARGLRVQIEREMAADQTAYKPPPKANTPKPPPAAAPQPHVPGADDLAADHPGPDAAPASSTDRAGAAFNATSEEGPRASSQGSPEAEPEPAGIASPDRRDER